MRAAGAVNEFRPGLTRHRQVEHVQYPAQAVIHRRISGVALLPGQPGAHTQQVLHGHGVLAWVGVFEDAPGVKIQDASIQAGNQALLQGDPHQDTDEALGHRVELVGSRRVVAGVIRFTDDPAVADHQEAVQAEVLRLDGFLHLRQLASVHALCLRGGGLPVLGGPGDIRVRRFC